MFSTGPSSKRLSPARAWLYTWSLVVVLAPPLLICLELTWRLSGYMPSVSDDINLWSYWRAQATRPDTVVLLGASRIQVGFSTSTFDELLPNYNLVQLAVEGSNPMATLKDLAEDEGFRGVVIYDFMEITFPPGAFMSNIQAEYIDYYHTRWSLDRKINRQFETWLQSRLVLTNPRLRLDKVARRIVTGHGLPERDQILTYADRSRVGDFLHLQSETDRLAAVALQRQKFLETGTPSADAWLTEALKLETYVRRIQERGGQVVFVKFPIADQLWSMEQEFWPRTDYWDRFAAQTAAFTIYFRDVPALSSVALPDMSHIDMRDVPRFTRVLIAELDRLGVIECAACDGEE